MKKIGILYGQENTFPFALIDKINSMNVPGIKAEAVQLDKVQQGAASGYAVIIDRISHSGGVPTKSFSIIPWPFPLVYLFLKPICCLPTRCQQIPTPILSAT
jgi:hypothetical protein